MRLWPKKPEPKHCDTCDKVLGEERQQRLMNNMCSRCEGELFAMSKARELREYEAKKQRQQRIDSLIEQVPKLVELLERRTT